MHGTRGDHSKRSVLTPATGVKKSKPKIWKVKRSKQHRKFLEKSKGQALLKVNRIPNLIKPHLVEQVQSRVKGLFEWRSNGQGPKFKVKFFDSGRGC